MVNILKTIYRPGGVARMLMEARRFCRLQRKHNFRTLSKFSHIKMTNAYGIQNVNNL